MSSISSAPTYIRAACLAASAFLSRNAVWAAISNWSASTTNAPHQGVAMGPGTPAKGPRVKAKPVQP